MSSTRLSRRRRQTSKQDEKAAAELIHDGIRASQAPGEAGGATTEEQKKEEEDDDAVMGVPLAGTGVVVLPSQAAGRGGRQKKDKGKGGRKGAQSQTSSQRGGKKKDKQSSVASSHGVSAPTESMLGRTGSAEPAASSKMSVASFGATALLDGKPVSRKQLFDKAQDWLQTLNGDLALEGETFGNKKWQAEQTLRALQRTHPGDMVVLHLASHLEMFSLCKDPCLWGLE